MIVEPDGTVVEEIEPDRPVRLEEGFSIAPDARSVVISYQQPGLTDTYADLATIDLETGEVEMVTHTPDVSETFPEFVDDGRVVFSRGELVRDAGSPNGAIAMLDLETGETATLTPNDHIAGTAAVLDEQTVVYDAVSGADDEPGLWRVGTDGNGAPELVSRGSGRYPSVSADGSEALLLEPVFGGSKVVLVKLNGR
ncbi:MAG: hypothetical protein M3134_01830 [Actinomycetota bacterium]|nr:hypothetical protein [Actinomycetota bacterium]